MDKIFMNSENSKTSEYHALVLKLADKLDLRRGHGVMNLNYQIDHIQYQIFKIILSIFLRNSENTDNPSIRIYVNKIENRITFKIKTGYYLELLAPETIKLLESTEIKITKDKNGENVPHLEVVELVLVHCNIIKNNYQ